MTCDCIDCVSDAWCSVCDDNLWGEDALWVKGKLVCLDCAEPKG